MAITPEYWKSARKTLVAINRGMAINKNSLIRNHDFLRMNLQGG
jgi:hypothetical protein